MYIKQLDFIISQNVDDYLASQNISLALELIKHVEQGMLDSSDVGWNTKQEIQSLKNKIIELIIRKASYDELEKSTMDISISFRARHRLWLKKIRAVFDLLKVTREELWSVIGEKTLFQEIYNYRISLLTDYIQLLEAESLALSSLQEPKVSTSEAPLAFETERTSQISLEESKVSTSENPLITENSDFDKNTISEDLEQNNHIRSDSSNSRSLPISVSEQIHPLWNNLNQQTSIETIAHKLNTRTFNILRRYKVDTLEILMQQTDEQLLSLWGLGQLQLDEINRIRVELREAYPAEAVLEADSDIDNSLIDKLPLSSSSIMFLERQGVYSKENLRNYYFTKLNRVTFSTPISVIADKVNKRTFNAINRHNIETLEELLTMSDEELLQIRNFGSLSLGEIQNLRGEFQVSGHYIPERVYLEIQQIMNLDGYQDNYSTIKTLAIDYQITLPEFQTLIHRKLAPLSWKYLLGEGYAWEAIEAFGKELIFRQMSLLLQELPSTTVIPKHILRELNEKGCPIQRITALRIVSSDEHLAVIQARGFKTILDIFTASLDGFEKNPDLVQNAHIYAEWLKNQTDWKNELINHQPSPLIIDRLRTITLDEIREILLGSLPERNSYILTMRYGLDGTEPKTLQEIADISSLTRERIRQITQRDMERLKRIFNSSNVLSALAHLAKQYIDTSKVLSEEELITQLMTHVAIDNPQHLQSLLIFMSEDLSESKIGERIGRSIWVSTRLPQGLAQAIISGAVEFLTEKMAPMTLEDIYQHLLEKLNLPDEFELNYDIVVVCFEADSSIEMIDEQYWGLTRWETKTFDDMVMVLRQLRRPAHFIEIARLVNERLSVAEQISSHSTHAQLARYTNLFVRTDSGTFGLLEWDPSAPVQPPKYSDLMEQVLEEFGIPMSANDIYEHVNKLRSAKLSSITMYLGIHEKFTSYGNGMYGLARWVESRVNEAGETTLVYCPRPFSIEATNPRTFFDSIVIGREFLSQNPDLTTKDFYTKMLSWANKNEHNWNNVQNAFDAWYAVGLIERVDAFNDYGILNLTMNASAQLAEIRIYCLDTLCQRVLKMPELLLTLKQLPRPTVPDIQKVLFGNEQAGFDVPHRLNILLALDGVQRVGDEWRLTTLGEDVLDSNTPQELPHFNILESVKEKPSQNSDDMNWEDELGLLDI